MVEKVMKQTLPNINEIIQKAALLGVAALDWK